MLLDGPDFIADGQEHTASFLLSELSWSGESAFFVVALNVTATDNEGAGCFVDDFTVTNASGWKDVGGAITGTAGKPALVGSGLLAPGSSNTLALGNAKPSAAALLVFGLFPLGAPFKGGTMVPMPQHLWPLPTGPGGSATTPQLLQLHFQVWIPDPLTSFGWAASNGPRGNTF